MIKLTLYRWNCWDHWQQLCLVPPWSFIHKYNGFRCMYAFALIALSFLPITPSLFFYFWFVWFFSFFLLFYVFNNYIGRRSSSKGVASGHRGSRRGPRVRDTRWHQRSRSFLLSGISISVSISISMHAYLFSLLMFFLQMILIQAVAATGTPTIVVLVEPRPRILTNALSNVSALLMAYLPGSGISSFSFFFFCFFFPFFDSVFFLFILTW